MTNTAESDFRQHVEKLESLLRDLESCADPELRGKAIDAIQTLMEFHGTGLSKLVDLIAKAGDAGRSIMASLAADDLVSSLLLLYNLHPANFDTRVRQAVVKVQPAVRSHGGAVELVAITDGSIHLRVERSGHGCGSSAAKIKTAIEEAIYDKAPEVTAIQIDGLGPPTGSTGFVPVEQLLGSHNGKSRHKPGDTHDSQGPAGAHACVGHE